MSNNTDVTSLSIMDGLFAVLAHILVVTIIVVLAWRQNEYQADKPVLRHIEVSMISAKQLQALQQKKPRQIKVHMTPPTQPKQIKAKPVMRIEPTRTPEPKLHTQTKPQPKKTRKVEPKAKEGPNFDPFAPIQSSSDAAPKQHNKSKSDIAQLMAQQLSKQEIEQYIQRMQQSVQQHWKVPGGIADHIPDPLVEVILKRNGEVASIHILESSGDPTLDQTLIAAIHAAAPFNVPQQQFESFRKNQIRFHPLR